MCASYGLQASVSEMEGLFQFDERPGSADVAGWLERYSADVVKPTGRIERKLNPIVRADPTGRTADLGWWGFLVGGLPAKFPSINTRSERLRDTPATARSRALVPATEWFEFEKLSKQKWRFSTGGLLAMAAVTQAGRPVDGEPVTCYSIIMQPARPDQAHLHDRMPLLLPPSFFSDWLDPTAQPSADLIDAALDAGREMTALVSVRPA